VRFDDVDDMLLQNLTLGEPDEAAPGKYLERAREILDKRQRATDRYHIFVDDGVLVLARDRDRLGQISNRWLRKEMAALG